MSTIFESFAQDKGGICGVVSTADNIEFLQAYDSGKATLRFTFADVAKDVLCTQTEVGLMQDLVRREQRGNEAIQNELNLAADSIIEQIKYRAV